MHDALVPGNPPSLAALSAVAARLCKLPASASRTAALNARNAAIQAALGSGRSTADVAAETGLTSRTVNKLSRQPVMAVPDARPQPQKMRSVASPPTRGPATFDEGNAMARAVLALKPSSCRMPIGEGEGFRFCGVRATVGHRDGVATYCTACASLAYAGRGRVTRPALLAEAA